MMKISVFILLLLLSVSAGYAETSRVSGVVQEKGTRKILSQTRIHIRELPSNNIIRSVITDETGGFDFELAPGEYMLLISASGYDKYEQRIIVKADQDVKLTLRASPQTINPYRIVVQYKKETPEVAAQTISIQEAVTVPGSNRDVLNVVANMPGVNSVSVFNGYGKGIVIRGSAQEDSLFTVEGHSIPDYYHFGGLESIIEPELVESIEYNAGGFSAEYGDTLGGVVAMKIKDPRTDRLGGYFNLGFLSSSFMLEGPISDNDSFALSMKRGFLDYYMKAANKIQKKRTGEDFGFTKYPMYYDGSMIFKRQLSTGNYVKFTGIGANDRFEFTYPEQNVSQRYSGELKYANRWFVGIGEWRYQQGRLLSRLSPKIGVYRFDIDGGIRTYHNQKVYDIGLNETLEYKANPVHTLKGGMKFNLYLVNVDSCSFVERKEGEISSRYDDLEMKLNKDFSLFYPEFFFIDHIKLGDWGIAPGINALYDSHNNKTIIDPRISLKYRINQQSLLKSATGLYSKKPMLDESLEPWGTKGLDPKRSVHGVVGLEHQFTPDIFMDIQTYYKYFFDMAVRIDEDDPTRYDSVGKGNAYGAEILLRHNMTDNFFGWISYSWSAAKRQDGPDKPKRYFDSDITHNFKALASYKPNRYWSVGLRYEYASGLPYTDLHQVETLYDVDNDQYYPIYNGPINNRRLKPRHRFDLRIDKYWLFDNWVLSAYIDVRNVFQQKYVTDMEYNKDYTDCNEEISLDSHVPLIFVGMKVDF